MSNYDEASKLWESLGDVPVDDDGNLEEAWNDFPVGTDREEIWHWFEETFDLPIRCLMFSNTALVAWWDRDQHDLDCGCGLCSSVTHASIGYAVFLRPYDEPYDVFYAPSEEAALENVRQFCRDNAFEFIIK